MEENMEDNQGQEETQSDGSWPSRTTGINRWVLIGGVALLLVAGLAFGYGYSQKIAVGHLSAQQSAASATIGRRPGQLNAVTTRLNDMVTAPQAAARAAEQRVAPAKPAGTQRGPG